MLLIFSGFRISKKIRINYFKIKKFLRVLDYLHQLFLEIYLYEQSKENMINNLIQANTKNIYQDFPGTNSICKCTIRMHSSGK